MANPQLHPLELNPLTKEPFLRLRNHKNIIITPPRASDIACYPPIINDPRVHSWRVITIHLLNSKGDAKYAEHAEAWYNMVKQLSDAVLAELDAAKDKTELIIVDRCPVRAIREVLDNGEDVYLGNIGFTRLGDGKLLGPPGVEINDELAPCYAAENAERVVGDPDIVWTVGYYLIPSHHSRGIMSDVLKTIMYDWLIPRMNVRRISAGALRGNVGSVKVFLKNGFRVTGLRENHIEVRGQMRDLHIVEWNFDDNNTP